jgi:acetyl-CoA carboxylase biotin carboxyl carrier protein
MATTIELKTDITGSVWKVLKRPGDPVDEEEPVLIMESMKMEVPVISPEAGVVREMLVKEGDTVSDGTVVARVEV